MLYFSVVIDKLQYTPVMWKSITSLMLEIFNAFRSSFCLLVIINSFLKTLVATIMC